MENTGFENSPFSVGEYRSPQTQKKSSSKVFLILFLALVLIMSGGYLTTKFLGSKEKKAEKKETIAPTPTEFQFPTETPATSVSPTSASTPMPTAKPTINPIDKTTGLDRSNITVEVQNGSGVVGVASKISDFLKGFGYHVTSVGNADKFDYENIIIEVKSSASKYLPLLKKDLSGQYAVGSTSAALSASSSADALIIIGK